MRIAGGTLRGRTVRTPSSEILRPTQDAVREAVFSMLAKVLPDATFLDLYAGTGAVGIEAWSRGAKSIVWIEKNPRVFRLLESNCETLVPPEVLDDCVLLHADAMQWLRHPTIPEKSVDIVFVDPPYVIREGADDGMNDRLERLVQSGILAQHAFVVVEQRAHTPVPSNPAFECVAERRYGHTAISIFRYQEPSAPSAGNA